MAALRKQASAGSTAGQFALGYGEDGFNQGPAAVFLAGKIGPHLSSDTMNSPGLLSAFGGDDAVGMKLLHRDVGRRVGQNPLSRFGVNLFFRD